LAAVERGGCKFFWGEGDPPKEMPGMNTCGVVQRTLCDGGGEVYY